MVATTPEERKPKVLLLAGWTRGITPIGSRTTGHQTITITGGRNAAAEINGSANQVPLEQVLGWDPDVIMIQATDPATPETLYAEPLLQTVAAVRDRRVCKVPLGGNRWETTQESSMAWVWWARLLHPDRFATPVRPVMRDTYRFLYGCDLTDADIDEALFREADRTSAHYARFDER